MMVANAANLKQLNFWANKLIKIKTRNDFPGIFILSYVSTIEDFLMQIGITYYNHNTTQSEPNDTQRIIN